MKISIYILLLIVLCLLPRHNKAQTVPNQGTSFELELPETNNSAYIARDYIRLKNGFKWSRTISGQSFDAKLDNYLIFPANYISEIEPSSEPVNTSLTVGKTTGIFDVSQTGAASYSIPITVAPGTSNMQPNLSITYNSQSGNGLMGVGFNILGLSSISRVPKVAYLDNEVGNINLNIDDRFSMDGNRLFPKSGEGAYGEPGTNYRTEVENFSTITSEDGDITNGPGWFNVTTKDGQTIEYGNSTDSRILVDGTSKAITWLISKVKDVNGNYINYIYYKDNTTHETVLKRIEYTGNDIAGLSPYNYVEFYYEKREDVNSLYIAGSEINGTLILNSIRVYNEGNILRLFKFKYAKGTNDIFSRLIEVSEFGKGGSDMLNSTIIKWGNSTVSSIEELPLYFNDLNYSFSYGDYNGDGFTDILKTQNTTEEFSHWYLYLNHNRTFLSNPDHSGTFYIENGGYYTDEDHLVDRFSASMVPTDFNGDGLEDVLIFKRNYVIEGVTYSSATAFHSTGTGFTSGTVFSTSLTSNKSYYFGDFNGDGITDILSRTIINGNFSYGYYFGTSNNSFNSYYPSFTTAGNLKVLDFNGNGKSDIIIYNNTYNINGITTQSLCNIYEINEITGNFTTTNLYSSSSFSPLLGTNIYSPVTLGDFNGDRKTDLLLFKNNVWKIHLSTGTGWVESTNTVSLGSHSTLGDNNTLETGDFNGDGKADIFENICSPHYDSGSLKILYSNTFTDGNQTFITEEFPNDYLHNKTSYARYSPIINDFNGDGKADILAHEFNYYGFNLWVYDRSRIFFSRSTYETKNLVQTISDGFRNNIDIEYTPLTNNTVYTKGTGSQTLYPLMDFQAAIPVVKTIFTPTGTSLGYTSNTYKYSGAVLHKTGKGYLGFKTIEVTNALNEQTKIMTFENEFISNDVYHKKFYYPVLASTVLKDEDDNYISQSVSTHQIKLTSTNSDLYPLQYFSFLPYVESNEEINNINSTSKNIAYNYSESDFYNGNLTSTTTTVSDNSSTITEDYQYVAVGSSIPNKMQQVITTMSKPTESDYVRTVEYEYYTNGLLKNKFIDPDLPKSVTANYEYDNLGNLTQTTISASGIETRSESTEYDTKGRFPIKMYNALDDFIEYTYDGAGNILTKKDLNGNITSFKYDKFNRLIETTFPTGMKTYNSLQWNIGNEPTGSVYFSQSTGNGIAPIKEYFDCLNRKIRTEAVGFNNQTITNDIVYNDLGQIWKTSKPHYDTDPDVFTENTYDQYGRISTVLRLPDLQKKFSYSGLTTTVTNMLTSQISSKAYNASGSLISASDNGGIINYTYYASGLPKTINSNGSEISMTYDLYGRRTSQSDPNTGTYHYEYDALGQLIYQSDAKAPPNTNTLTYDKLGRILTDIGTEGTYTYTFYTKPYGKGLVGNISGPGGMSQEMTYDTYSRNSSITETIDGLNYTTLYEFDNLGNNTKITYPGTSGFAVNLLYDQSNSLLNEVKRADNDASIWQLQDLNVYGQVTGYYSGNGKLTTKQYNTYGMPTRFTTPGILDYEFGFSPTTGNLFFRKDWFNNLAEGFEYDLLDRLTHITGISPAVISYCQNGNIDTRTGVGIYSYTLPQPHAVSSIENSSSIIPSIQQDITYTSFNKVSTISEPENVNYQEFFYGIDQERRKVLTYEDGDLIKTKYYSSNYEKIISPTNGTKEVFYIPGGDGIAAVYIKENGTENMYYTYTDYLGSILAITDQAGTVVERRSYDAWGRERNPYNWTYNSTDFDHLIDRGFTGHEHMSQFNLINMNGRLYDPLIGRFLSPDNFVQTPGYTQSLNRYSYCINNPLKYTDPRGNFFVLFPMVLSGIIAGDQLGYYSLHSGQGYWSGFQKGFAIGFSSYGLGYGCGAVLGQGLLSSTFTGILVGGYSGGLTNLAMGGDFWQGAKNGAIIGGISGFVMGVIDEASTSHHSSCTASDVGTTSGDEVPYNQATGEEYMGEVNGLEKLHSDGSHRYGSIREGDKVFSMVDGKFEEAYGETYRRWFSNGKSTTWLYKNAFANEARLQIVVAHEKLHITYNYLGGITHNREFWNYNIQESQARKLNFELANYYNYDHISSLGYGNIYTQYTEFSSNLVSKYDYSRFGFGFSIDRMTPQPIPLLTW